VTDYRVDNEFKHIGRRTRVLNARRNRRADDRPDEILLAIEDITEREQAEDFDRNLHEQLEQRVADQTSEIRLLAEAISHLGEGVLITNDDLVWPGPHIRFVNDAMCRISGYSAKELIGQSPRILQGDETSEATRAHVRHELAANRTCSVELTNYRKDGTTYEAELFITPLFDAAGQRTNFVSIHRDITERKQTERALREREDRLRSILNTASEAIINIDRRGIITDVNPATEQLFGYTQEELVGQNVRILMPAPYKDEHDGYIARYLETGEARIVGSGREVVGRRQDGSMFSAWLAVSEVEHLGLFTGIVRDLSERKNLQRDVLGVAEGEQRRIGQDLHDSTQQELAGLGMLAQTVLDNLVTEADEPREGSAAKHFELANKIVDGIARTHQQVQTISRGLVPVQLDDDGFMNALRELASRTDGLEGVTCAFKCEQPVEVADSVTATHLYRIAQEAVTNALKHGRPEHILIALESENGHPMLQIADDGTGFELTGQYEGMGLKSMFYRASLIGANLTLGPVETGGTLVTCKVFGGGNLR
jgi:PAS domain S-box-containing protein